MIVSTSYGEKYEKHPVFEKIEHMMDYYDGLSYSCFCFIPHGTLGAANYASYVYTSIRTTLASIHMLLKAGHISDAFVLIRKLFDTVQVEIYLNVMMPPNTIFIPMTTANYIRSISDWKLNRY